MRGRRCARLRTEAAGRGRGGRRRRMATLFRCTQGHVWEDLFDGASLVGGEVRCPQCGQSSRPGAPVTAPAAADDDTPLPTRTVPLPAGAEQVPPTALRPALAGAPPRP